MFKERFNEAAKGLNNHLYQLAVKLPDNVKTSAQEIRIRVNRPISINCNKNIYYLEDNGVVRSVPTDKISLQATQQDVIETFQNLCCYSVYSRQNEIKNGFITIKGGHRAGICGTAVYSNNELINIRDISSINIRIARQIYGSANNIIKTIPKLNKGLLICGAPSSGKTTILRDLARQLSNNNTKVTVIDERGEIAGTSEGIYQNDLGQCDVLDGYFKKEGFSHAIRCLSPQIIICDEIGNKADIEFIKEGLNAGVSVIATIHSGCAEELLKKPYIKELLNTGAFYNVVFLENSTNPGQIRCIHTMEELLNAENYGGNSFNNIKRSSRVYSLCKTKN